MVENSDRGFLYCVIGDEFVEEAKKSAKSVRAHHQEPITLVTDVDVDANEYFDTVLRIDNPSHPSYEQIRNLSRSPYDRTIKLDTDTYLTDNVSELFEWLDRFDVAMALDPATKRDSDQYPVPNVPDSFPEYNAGVMVYQNDENFRKFQSDWENKFENHSHADPPYNQPSLRGALYESDLRIAALPCEYNCRFDFVGHAVDKIRIVHGRTKDVDSYGMVKKYNIDEIVDLLNKSEDPRAYAAHGDNIRMINKSEPTRFQWIMIHLKTKGMRKTLEEIYRRFG